MRVALTLERILKELQEWPVSPRTLTDIQKLYKAAYREGYGDGKSDCEEARGEDEERVDDLR